MNCSAPRNHPHHRRGWHLAVAWMLCLWPWVSSSAATTRVTARVPGAVWLDTQGHPINAHGGGMLRVGDTYYWYGEAKTDGPGGNTAHIGVSVYRSHDLLNWTAMGIALHVVSDPHSDITDGAIIERPKVIFNRTTHTYVMWFHLERRGRGYKDGLIGIATSRTPTGPFTYLHALHPNGHDSRDMTVFQDDDGKAYVFYSSEGNATMHIARLTDDYLGVRPQETRIFIDQCLEAPAVFKSGAHYFFVGSTCTGWKPNAAHGAVADHITGPWKAFGNPAKGPDAALTFHSQSTYVLPLPGQPGHFVYMGDRWNPAHPVDGRYIWLPLDVHGKRFTIRWEAAWRP